MSGAQGRTVAAVTLSVDRRGSGKLRLWQLALAALAGNLALHQLPVLPQSLLVLSLTLAALALFAALAAAGTRSLWWLGLGAVALLAFCYTAAAARDRLETRWPETRDGQDVAVRGWIDGFPPRDQGRVVFSLRVIASDADPAPRRLRLSWYDPAPPLVPGQVVRLQARLRSPRGLVNPAGFDYERWLFLEGYDATGYVRDGATEAVPEPGDVRASETETETETGSGSGGGLARRWLQLRARLVERLNASIAPPDAAALIVALSLGERTGFDERHWRVLQRTGTSHLVAVSGLHIGLIAALAYWLALKCALRLPAALARRAHDCAAATALVAATGYAALAGFGLPTQRALVMLVVAFALAAGRRRWPIPNGLALAVILVLAHDPMASLTASFWLSFGAVALLLATAAGASRAAARSRRPADRAPRRLTASVIRFGRLQWLLTLGLGPLVLAFYGQISLSSMIVNLVAIPLFSLLLVPLSLLCALCAFFGSHGFGLVAVAGHLTALAWHGLEIIAASPMAAFELPRPRWFELALSLVAIAAVAPGMPLPSRRLAWLALLPLVVNAAPRALPVGDARFTVLDVGHGLAVVVATRSHRLLYDAGPLTRSGFDDGAEIVAPVLASLGNAPLDLLVLSHGDSDHAGGAAAVVARYPGVRILAGPDVDAFAADPCQAGQSWTWDDVRFVVLHPPAGYPLHGNDSSCVLRIEAEAGAVLLSGDIERRAEAVLAADPAIAADVVIVPHHGSATSSTAKFVNAVAPDVAIVSAAYRNRWNFPRPEVRRRWLDVGARVLVTGEKGAIDIDLSRSGIVVHAARARARRYWQATDAAVSGAVTASAL